MSENTIKCLIYRYKRTTKERLYAVIINDGQFTALNEIDYKTNENFFLNSEFSKFIGYTPGCSIDFCVINENDVQGAEFLERCKEYYNYTDINTAIWTDEFIYKALSSLDLKKTLILNGVSVEGRDGSRPDIVSLYVNKNIKSAAAEIHEEDSRELSEKERFSEELSLDKKTHETIAQADIKENTNKTKLRLAMDEIIHETYNT